MLHPISEFTHRRNVPIMAGAKLQSFEFKPKEALNYTFTV